jgi:hypothetical protein
MNNSLLPSTLQRLLSTLFCVVFVVACAGSSKNRKKQRKNTRKASNGEEKVGKDSIKQAAKTLTKRCCSGASRSAKERRWRTRGRGGEKRRSQLLQTPLLPHSAYRSRVG